tara:strand:- start:5709 stop:6140 length:432 start_codon:yes stop_codon:yes gene_type:complete
MKNLILKIFLFLNIFETLFAFSQYSNNKIIKHKSIINYNSIHTCNMNNNICPEYLHKFTNLLDQEQSEIIVKSVTGFLTKVDGFGGYVLHSNDVIINYILNNDLLSLEQKKDIILFFIKLSQYGDSMGSHILQFYHDLVNCLI